MWRKARGFTLLEVLVALCILAIALAAILRALSGAITTTGALRHRTIALWVAENRWAHVEVISRWLPLGRSVTTAREDHRWFAVVTRVRATAVPLLRRISIHVRGHHQRLVTIIGFVRAP